MATVTPYIVGKNQPEAIANGALNTAICRLSLSTTSSAGDVIRIGKLPNRAIPVDVVFYAGTALVTNTITKFGLSGTDACFIASASFSTAAGVVRGNVNLNQLENYTSRSDDAAQRFTYIVATPTLALSVGHVGTLVVWYKMPGQTL